MPSRKATMNALELLESQHGEVEDLFEQIENSKIESKKMELFIELADKLAAHAKIEELIFYPAVMAKQTEEILLESVEEHLSIKRLLADLLELDVDDDQFDAKISVMKEQIEHHARQEEEGELFPKVKKLLSSDDLDALGGEMLAKFEELLSTEPRMEVPNETETAARIE